MAERRMFSKSIINAGKFLRMPPTSRLLYYDLGMAADDDGVVEAYSVMLQTKATEDDLRVLVSKGYVRILNEDLVLLICDWNINNLIRSDRYHKSIYAELIAPQPNGNQPATNPQPNNNQMETEVRLGKVSIGKGSLGESEGKRPPAKKTHGEYKNVLLTDEELSKLINEIPNAGQYIERLSEYMASTGKLYESHFATIRSWWKEDKTKPPKPSSPAANGDSFDLDEWCKQAESLNPDLIGGG